MKVLANKYLNRFRELLPDEVDMDQFDPQHLPENAPEYDALFVNTTTQLNERTLPDPGNISFVATGSSGTDHLDLDYLHSKGITTADAAGCNARTVAEYVITSILCLHEQSGIPLIDLKAGIVGIGHVGTEVSRMLTRFSIPYISYDPPRSDQDINFTSAHFDELKECNLLTFHTPLTHSGDYPTHHLLNRSWFRGANYHLLINTARGGVIDEQIVLEQLETGRLKNAVIDVWESEPAFNTELADAAIFATPHIAGYSAQSKLRATDMIIDRFCTHAGIKKVSAPKIKVVKPDLAPSYDSLTDLLCDLHPICEFDKKMRSYLNLDDEKRAEKFLQLRTETGLRHEYSSIAVDSAYHEQFPELALLGVQVKES